MRKAFREAEPAAALHDNEGDFLRLAAGLENGKPVFSLDQIIQQLTSGTAWDGAPGHPVPRAGVGTITYAFFNSAAEV